MRLIKSHDLTRWITPAAAVFLLAGCSTPSEDGLEPGGDNPTAATSGGLAPEEFEAAYTACMEESGWHLSKDEFGQDSIELSEGQDEDYERAAEACSSKFEVDPKYSEPLDDEQWAVVHSHYRDNVIPCLESLGYTPDDLPSLDAFTASMNSPDAYQIISPEVYGSIVDDVTAGRWESPDDVINDKCEVSPPDGLLYP